MPDDVVRITLNTTRVHLRRDPDGQLLAVLDDKTREVELALPEPATDQEVLTEISALALRMDWSGNQLQGPT